MANYTRVVFHLPANNQIEDSSETKRNISDYTEEKRVRLPLAALPSIGETVLFDRSPFDGESKAYTVEDVNREYAPKPIDEGHQLQYVHITLSPGQL